MSDQLEVRGWSSTPDRRHVRRWSASDVSSIASVRVAGDGAELVNISSEGALVRTHTRPQMESLKPLHLNPGASTSVIFHLASGQNVRAAGRVVRSHIASIGNGPVLFDVAFRFDESVGLDLPTVMPPAADAGDNVMSLAIGGVSPEARTHHVHEVLNHSVTLQNELLARLVGDGALSNSLRDAVSELTAVNAALVEIRGMLREARRTRTPDAELLNLANCLAPRIQELHALRSVVVERISRDDLALIASQKISRLAGFVGRAVGVQTLVDQ